MTPAAPTTSGADLEQLERELALPCTRGLSGPDACHTHYAYWPDPKGRCYGVLAALIPHVPSLLARQRQLEAALRECLEHGDYFGDDGARVYKAARAALGSK